MDTTLFESLISNSKYSISDGYTRDLIYRYNLMLIGLELRVHAVRQTNGRTGKAGHTLGPRIQPEEE